jgi:glutathione-regulated potassium-efflux system ancillary protein KefF
MLLLVFAHPYSDRSRANDALLRSVADLEGLELRSLYERYPDFAIDVEDEQAALLRARVVIWQHPLYWYSVPSLLKHWFDKVLTRGWAYGEGGTQLHGKRCLWVVTTGAGDDAYHPEGMHGHPFAAFIPQIEQTARFCGMRWEPPLVVHAAHKIEPAELESAGRVYRERLERLLGEVREAKRG